MMIETGVSRRQIGGTLTLNNVCRATSVQNTPPANVMLVRDVWTPATPHSGHGFAEEATNQE